MIGVPVVLVYQTTEFRAYQAANKADHVVSQAATMKMLQSVQADQTSLKKTTSDLKLRFDASLLTFSATFGIFAGLGNIVKFQEYNDKRLVMYAKGY